MELQERLELEIAAHNTAVEEQNELQDLVRQKQEEILMRRGKVAAIEELIAEEKGDDDGDDDTDDEPSDPSLNGTGDKSKVEAPA